MKKVIIYLIAILLFGCNHEHEGDDSVKDSHFLPKLPLNFNLDNFSVQVQQQFIKRISYIKQIKKQYNDKAKYGWAIGQLCKTFHAYQKYKEAESCYFNAIFNNPKSKEWPYLLAHVFKTVGNYTDSKKYFNKTLKMGDDTPSKVWLADVLIEQNQYYQANEIISSILHYNSNHPMALYKQGVIYEHFKKSKLAINSLQKVLITQPQAYQVHYKLGQVYSTLKNSSKADHHFSKVPDDSNLKISIQFDDPFMQSVSDLRIDIQSTLKKAIKASSQGRHGIALELLNKLKKTHPNRIDITYNLALVNLKMNRLNKAKNTLKEIIHNEDDKIYRVMAQIYKLEKKYDQSIVYLQKALEIKPENAFYLSELANIYALKKEFIYSIAYYNQSLAIDSDQELIHLKKIRVLLQAPNNFNLIRKILKEKVISKKFSLTKQNILSRINILTQADSYNITLPSILDGEISMNYETKAMLAFKNNNLTKAIDFQQIALKNSKNKKSRELIKSRLENYKKNKANTLIWFINEDLINE